MRRGAAGWRAPATNTCQAQRPPSTSMQTPLMKAASSLARYSAALATSRAVEKRPSGMVDRNLARRASSSGPPANSAGQAGIGVEHRVDAVHPDVVRPEFGRQRLAQRDDRALGAVVPGQAGPRAQAGGRGDVDEAATALRAEHRRGVHGREVQAFHVDREAAVELVFAHFERRAVAVCPAGVVDHHVEPAECLQRLGHQRLHVGGTGHVCGAEDGVTTGAADRGGDPFAGRGLDVVDHHTGTFLGQPPCDTLADAATRAGDDDHFVLDAHA
jgi:hypothetical protein